MVSLLKPRVVQQPKIKTARVVATVAATALACLVFLSGNTVHALSDTAKVTFPLSEISLINGKSIKKITVEIAETEDQHERGLMFRKSLENNKGMLFIFNDSAVRYFWMKNTLIDLSIGYFSADKKLIDIQEMKAVTSVLQVEIPNYPSLGPAQYALEMPAKWFDKNHVAIGATLKLKADK